MWRVGRDSNPRPSQEIALVRTSKTTKEKINFHDPSVNLHEPLQHPLSSVKIISLFQVIYLHNVVIICFRECIHITLWLPIRLAIEQSVFFLLRLSKQLLEEQFTVRGPYKIADLLISPLLVNGRKQRCVFISKKLGSSYCQCRKIMLA